MAVRKPPSKSRPSKILILPQKRNRLSRILILITLLGGIYYFFLSTPGHNTNNPQSKSKKPFKRPPLPPGRFNWHERKETYPVSSYHTLPSPSSSTTSPSTPKNPIPQIQHHFPLNTPAGAKLTPEDLVTREQLLSRRRLIRNAFLHAWRPYRDFALGHDVLLPVTGSSRNSHHGWGLTLLDALETLLVMGLRVEFEEAVRAVARVDFTRSEAPTVEVFGGTVSVLGALLGAYEMSEGEFPVLLEKAVEVGDFLYGAFDTPNRMPVSRWEWKRTQAGQVQEAFDDMLVGELPALTVEFTRLTQLSGDPKFFDAVQRVTNLLSRQQKETQLPGLWPLTIDAQSKKFDKHHAFTMGWMAEGAFNYLTAQHLLLSGHTSQIAAMYELAVNTAINHTIFSPMLPTSSTKKDEKILLSSLARVINENATSSDGQIQHASCYIPSLLALGSKIYSRPGDLDIAKRLAAGCVWAHDAFDSGLMPEALYVIPCHDRSPIQTDGTPQQERRNDCEWSEKRWLEGVMSMDEDITDDNVREKVKEQGLSKGIIAVTDHRFLLRPHLIHSLFVLYRTTGEKRYQEEAWKLFTTIDKATRAKYGHAALKDVTREVGDRGHEAFDQMDSYWLGETLKWFYLLFSREEVLDLDEWAISGEGHLMRWKR